MLNNNQILRPSHKLPTGWLSLQAASLVAVALFLTLLGCSKGPSRIRVQNLTQLDFADVALNTNRFGALKAGATSDYQEVARAFERMSAFTKESNGVFHNDRFMGGRNPELRSGSYTYVLEFDTNHLFEVRLKKS